MALELKPAETTQDYAAQWTNIILSANEALPTDDPRNLYLKSTWPNHRSPKMTSRMQSMLYDRLSTGSPKSLAMQVVDVQTNRAVGAIYAMFKEEGIEDKKPSWLKELTREDYPEVSDLEFWKIFQVESTKLMRCWLEGIPGSFFQISTLAVLPEYQGHGISRMLIKSVVDHADAFGAMTAVITVEDIEQVYAKHGFVRKYAEIFPLPEKWNGRQSMRSLFMIREPVE